MLTKKNGQTKTFMSIMLMTKLTLNMWMWSPFYNRSGVIVSCENMWTNSSVQMYSLVTTKQPIFVSKWNSVEKETSEIFDCTRWFSLQNLNSTIRLFKVCFWRKLEFGDYFFGHLEDIFLANFYTYNTKPLFHVVETSLF